MIDRFTGFQFYIYPFYIYHSFIWILVLVRFRTQDRETVLLNHIHSLMQMIYLSSGIDLIEDACKSLKMIEDLKSTCGRHFDIPLCNPSVGAHSWL